MIKEAWLWDDEGFGTTRKTVLTEDHFYKNIYSWMRVHLAVQIVLELVVNLIDRYTRDQNIQKEKEQDMEKKYAPLKKIMLSCDRLVHIWNANYSKKCECINSPDHPHLRELRSILLLFAEWKTIVSQRMNSLLTNHGRIYVG